MKNFVHMHRAQSIFWGALRWENYEYDIKIQANGVGYEAAVVDNGAGVSDIFLAYFFLVAFLGVQSMFCGLLFIIYFIK